MTRHMLRKAESGHAPRRPIAVAMTVNERIPHGQCPQDSRDHSDGQFEIEIHARNRVTKVQTQEKPHDEKGLAKTEYPQAPDKVYDSKLFPQTR